MAELDGPRLPPRSGKPARQLVVLLHGVGADGADLIGLAPTLAETLPDAAFVAPDAPFPCDMAPYGRQWFSLQDRSPARLARTGTTPSASPWTSNTGGGDSGAPISASSDSGASSAPE